MSASSKAFGGRARRLFNEAFWIVLGTGLTLVGSLVGLRLLTELLHPAEYGELALGMTIATLVSQVILGPLGSGIYRYYAPAAEARDVPAYLRAAGGLIGQASALIVVLTALCGVTLWLAGHGEWATLAAVAVVYALVNGYNSVFNSIQNAARHRPVVALHQSLEVWLRFLGAAALLVVVAATSVVAIVGYVVASAAVLVSQVVFLKKLHPAGTAEGRGAWRRSIWDYSWPFALFGGFTWMHFASDRWALKLVSTSEEVGLYTAVYQVGYYSISVITGMAVEFLAPIFFQRAGNAEDAERTAHVSRLSWRVTSYTLALTGVAFAVTLALHGEIFGYFVADRYRVVSHLLPWIILGGGLFAAGQTIALSLMSQMKTRMMIWTKIGTALLGMFSNFVGAYWYATPGVVIGGLVFGTAYAASMALVALREEALLRRGAGADAP